jgi:positive regulator of sigma E activity
MVIVLKVLLTMYLIPVVMMMVLMSLVAMLPE